MRSEKRITARMMCSIMMIVMPRSLSLRETLAAYAEAKRQGWGAEDFSGVPHVIEKRFGRKI